MNDAIQQAILNHESQDVAKISMDLGRTFNQFIPRTYVTNVLSRNKRAFSVSNARERASQGIEDKVTLMEDVAAALLSQFGDNALTVSERMKVAAELRQWTKMTMDVAGIHDEETGQLWVIGEEWDTRHVEHKPN